MLKRIITFWTLYLNTFKPLTQESKGTRILTAVDFVRPTKADGLHKACGSGLNVLSSNELFPYDNTASWR